MRERHKYNSRLFPNWSKIQLPPSTLGPLILWHTTLWLGVVSFSAMLFWGEGEEKRAMWGGKQEENQTHLPNVWARRVMTRKINKRPQWRKCLPHLLYSLYRPRTDTQCYYLLFGYWKVVAKYLPKWKSLKIQPRGAVATKKGADLEIWAKEEDIGSR